MIFFRFNGCAEDVGNFVDIPNHEKTQPLSEDTVVACIRLGSVLRRIRARLLSEGYNIVNGTLVKSEKVYE